MEHAAAHDPDPASARRWVDKQGVERWRAAPQGGGAPAAGDAPHHGPDDRWKTPEERASASARRAMPTSTDSRSRQGSRWDDEERRGRSGLHKHQHQPGNNSQAAADAGGAESHTRCWFKSGRVCHRCTASWMDAYCLLRQLNWVPVSAEDSLHLPSSLSAERHTGKQELDRLHCTPFFGRRW